VKSRFYQKQSDYNNLAAADIIWDFTQIMYEPFRPIPHQRDADPLEECVIEQFLKKGLADP